MLRGREGMLYFVFNSDVIAVVVAHNIGLGEFVAQVSTPCPHYSLSLCCIPLLALVSSAACRSSACHGDAALEVIGCLACCFIWIGADTLLPSAPVWRRLLAGPLRGHCAPGGAPQRPGSGGGSRLPACLPACKHACLPLGCCTCCQRHSAGVCHASCVCCDPALPAVVLMCLLHLQVRTIRPWTMAGRVANTFQQGRAFLAGDAAHAFPPSGGWVGGMLAAPALSLLPANLRKSALEAAMSVGKAAASPIRRLRASELAGVFDHGETLRLQFPKEDLGYVYAAGAGEQGRHSAGACGGASQLF